MNPTSNQSPSRGEPTIDTIHARLDGYALARMRIIPEASPPKWGGCFHDCDFSALHGGPPKAIELELPRRNVRGLAVGFVFHPDFGHPGFGSLTFGLDCPSLVIEDLHPA